jgi:hypothetical protein
MSLVWHLVAPVLGSPVSPGRPTTLAPAPHGDFVNTTLLCPKCGQVGDDKPNCCSSGGAWEGMCGEGGQYTHHDGYQACNGAVLPIRPFSLGSTTRAKVVNHFVREEIGPGPSVCNTEVNTIGYTLSAYVDRLLWPDGLQWVELPPKTHVVLFGSSHIGQLSQALQFAALERGTHIRRDIVVHTNFCTDPAAAGDAHDSGPAQYFADTMKCGLESTACPELVSHGIYVDHLAGDSSITTISNHPSQLNDTALESWLSRLAPREADGRPAKFTHGAFMAPHEKAFFDAQCTKEKTHGRTMPANVGTPYEHCKDPYYPDQFTYCKRDHPRFDTVARWVVKPLAAVLYPAEEFAPVPEAVSMSCVTDEQLATAECGGEHNLTVWLSEAYSLYSGAQGAVPVSVREGCRGVVRETSDPTPTTPTHS